MNISLSLSLSLTFVHQPARTANVEIRRNNRGPSLVLSLTKAYGFSFFVGGIFKLGNDLLAFASPQFLK